MEMPQVEIVTLQEIRVFEVLAAPDMSDNSQEAGPSRGRREAEGNRGHNNASGDGYSSLPLESYEPSHKSSCVMYHTWTVDCSGDPKRASSYFIGSTTDMFKLIFILKKEGQFVDLEIVDKAGPRCPEAMCLGRFKLAELVLQFRKITGKGSSELVHQEPTIAINLESIYSLRKDGPCPNSTLFSAQDLFASFANSLSFTCEKVIPTDKLNLAAVQIGKQLRVRMVISLKLLKGDADVSYATQKLFHPDKTLFDLREKMEIMLLEGVNSDTVIQSGDDKFYKAHRSILAANSEVFRAMFDSKMKEDKTGKVVMAKHDTGKVVEALLKYLYARNCKDLEGDSYLTTDVLSISHRYQIPLLVTICEERLLAMPLESFNLDGALYTFHTAVLLESLCVQTKCVQVIMRMEENISESQTFRNFNRNHPDISAKLTEMILRFQKFAQK